MRLKLIIVALFLCSVTSLFAEDNYRVTSSSLLNVRRSPSTDKYLWGNTPNGNLDIDIDINETVLNN